MALAEVRHGPRVPRRASLGASVVFMAAALEAIACGGTPAVTPTPFRTPESTPSPIPTLVTPLPDASPSPFITPSPTPEITASPVATASPTRTPEITVPPTPEATPVTLSGIIDSLIQEASSNGYPDPSKTTVEDQLTLVLQDPAVANGTMPPPFDQTIGAYIQQGWEMLRTGGDDNIRENGATQTIVSLYRGLQIDNNENIYVDPLSNGAIEFVLDYANHHLSASNFNDLISNLHNIQ